MTDEHIGSRIKEIRQELDFTQVEFATETGISPSFVSFIETGAKKPSFELLYSLCLKYNVNINWLLTGQGEMFNFSRTTDKMERFAKLFPDVPAEPDIVEMFEIMEVPVMRYQLIRDYLVRSEEHKILIEEYYKKKEQIQRGVK